MNEVRIDRDDATLLSRYVIERTKRPLDDPETAAHIVTFWERGTASNSESKIIEAYLANDEGLKKRFAVLFPALVNALKSAGYKA